MILLTIALITSDIIGHEESEKRSQQPISRSQIKLLSALFAISILLKRRASRNCSQLAVHVCCVSASRTRTSRTPKKALKPIEEAGIAHIDIIIANSGVSIGAIPLELADPRYFAESFSINALSTVVLYQALSNLLKKSRSPK